MDARPPNNTSDRKLRFPASTLALTHLYGFMIHKTGLLVLFYCFFQFPARLNLHGVSVDIKLEQ